MEIWYRFFGEGIMGFQVLDNIGKGFFAFRTVEGERRETGALSFVFGLWIGLGLGLVFGFGGCCGWPCCRWMIRWGSWRGWNWGRALWDWHCLGLLYFNWTRYQPVFIRSSVLDCCYSSRLVDVRGVRSCFWGHDWWMGMLREGNSCFSARKTRWFTPIIQIR